MAQFFQLALFLTLTFLAIFTSCGEVDVWGDGVYKFGYEVNKSSETITFSAEVKTKGWIGFGFSPDGQMPDSDVIMAYIDKSGKPVAMDAYAAGRTMPKKDEDFGTTQHITDLSGSLDGDVTKIKVTRKLKTDDKYDYEIKKDETVKLIFSIGDKNPSDNGDNYSMHNKVKSLSIVLYPETSEDEKSAIENEISMSETSIMTLNISPVKIPAKRTNYYCQYFNIKQLLEEKYGKKDIPKHHAVKFQPDIKSKEVHHILIFSCHTDQEYTPETQECSAGMNYLCTSVIALTSPAADDITTPPEAGFVWGYDDTKVVWMEIHYDNPELKTDVVDTSGFKIHYTDELRKYNMGVTITGYQHEKLKLEPGKKSQLIEAPCMTKCWSQINTQGINVAFVFLHGHKLLKKVRMEITQDGKLDDTTFKTDYYDFNVQYLKTLDKHMHLKPDAKVSTFCDYDTSDQTKEVLGGDGTDNEMCYGFIGYYPREFGMSVCNYPGNCDSQPYSAVGIPQLGTKASASAGYLKITMTFLMMMVMIIL